MEEQVKEPTTVEQQLVLLRERGMAVDAELARQWFRSVSYYRLSGYWYPYRVPVESDPRKPVRLDEFVEGTTFSEIAGLYEFDRKLRTLGHYCKPKTVRLIAGIQGHSLRMSNGPEMSL